MILTYLFEGFFITTIFIYYFDNYFGDEIINIDGKRKQIKKYTINKKNIINFIQFSLLLGIINYYIDYLTINNSLNLNFKMLFFYYFTYFYIYTFINDLHFYLWHITLHEIKWLYKNIHKQHHLNKYTIASDFIDQHILELFISSLPFFYIPYIFSFIPSYIHKIITYTIIVNGFIGHSMYNIQIKKILEIRFDILIISIFIFPLIILNKICKYFLKTNCVMDIKHHHIHHIKYNYNYSETYIIIDKFFNTYKSVKNFN